MIEQLTETIIMIIIHYHFDPLFFFVTTEVLTFASKTLVSPSHFVCVRVSKRLGNAEQEAPWCSLTAEGLWKWRLSVSLTITAAGKHIQDKTGSDFHLFNHLSFIIKHSPHNPSCVSFVFLLSSLTAPSFFLFRLRPFSSFSSSVQSFLFLFHLI